MGRMLCGVVFAILLPFLAQAQDGRTIIVLDASGSMWGQIDGRPKLEIAREALATVLAGVPSHIEIGLMAYGHRTKGDCGDIELIVPPAEGKAQAIISAANGLKFLGKTPLTDAVRLAAEEMRSTEATATVILITDGIETCLADPCVLGTELEATGVDFTAHVVGFGLTDAEGATVACLAENTGGQYFQAKDAGSLVDALQSTVVAAPAPAPEPTPAPAPAPEPVAAPEFNLVPALYLAEGGPAVVEGAVWEVYGIAADGARGDLVAIEYADYRGQLPAGTYRLVGRIGQATAEVAVTVTSDAVAEPQVILNAGTLVLRPRVAADAPVDPSAALRLTNAAGMDTIVYGETQVVVPAGETTITLRIGEAVVTETVSLAPGETLEKEMVAGAGVAVVDAFYVNGVIMDGTQHSVEILKAAKALDGSQESLGVGYGPGVTFTLPPGDYVARVRQGAAVTDTPFAVTSGQRVEVKVVLNAGVLAVSAPGATSIEVLDGKADISGNRASRSFDYAETINLVAPGGDYLIVVKRGETRAEATATVTPGERSEITVP